MKVKWKSFSHVWLFVTPWTIQSKEFFRILEYSEAVPFTGPSQPRDWIQVSRIVSTFFTSWATREVLINLSTSFLKIKFLNGTLLHTCLLTLPNGKSHFIHRSRSVRNRKNINPLWGMKIQTKLRWWGAVKGKKSPCILILRSEQTFPIANKKFANGEWEPSPTLAVICSRQILVSGRLSRYQSACF